MECLYKGQNLYIGDLAELNYEEAKHARALRLRLGDKVILTNGMGSVYITKIILFDKDKLIVEVQDVHPLHGESERNIHLFLGLIDYRDRLEFCIEKSIELGIREITLIKTAYSSQKLPNLKRLESKAIAAIKQCKRSILPKINYLDYIESFGKHSSQFDSILLADESGNNFSSLTLTNNIAVFVGAEGGFSKDEIEFISSFSQTATVKLGERRLRAETAAIALCVLCSNL